MVNFFSTVFFFFPVSDSKKHLFHITPFLCIFTRLLKVHVMGLSGGSAVKNLPANTGDSRDMGLIYGLGRPLERKWQPAPVFLIEKSSG